MPRKSSVVIVALLGTAALLVRWLWNENRAPFERSVQAGVAEAVAPSARELVPPPESRREARTSELALPRPPRAAPNSAGTDALAALAPCLLDMANELDPQAKLLELRACLAGHEVVAITAPELARWLCDTRPPRLGRRVLIEQVLSARAPEEFLPFVDELQGALCDGKTELLQQAAELLWGESADPVWAARVEESIDARTLFGGVSDGPVQLTWLSVVHGDTRIRELLAAGARGELGGTPQQMTCAANVAALHTHAGESYLAFCASLLDSATTTPDERMGGLIATFLIRGQARLDEGWQRSAALLERLLEDPRFARDAAAQLLSNSAEPQGMPPADWQRILARARGVLAR